MRNDKKEFAHCLVWLIALIALISGLGYAAYQEVVVQEERFNRNKIQYLHYLSQGSKTISIELPIDAVGRLGAWANGLEITVPIESENPATFIITGPANRIAEIYRIFNPFW